MSSSYKIPMVKKAVFPSSEEILGILNKYHPRTNVDSPLMQRVNGVIAKEFGNATSSTKHIPIIVKHTIVHLNKELKLSKDEMSQIIEAETDAMEDIANTKNIFRRRSI